MKSTADEPVAPDAKSGSKSAAKDDLQTLPMLEVKEKLGSSHRSSPVRRRRPDETSGPIGPRRLRQGVLGILQFHGRTAAGTLSHVNHFKPLLAKAELPDTRFHELRHTSATLLLTAGGHPKVVQERLGNSQIGITLDTYSHLVPTLQLEAATKLDGAHAVVAKFW